MTHSTNTNNAAQSNNIPSFMRSTLDEFRKEFSDELANFLEIVVEGEPERRAKIIETHGEEYGRKIMSHLAEQEFLNSVRTLTPEEKAYFKNGDERYMEAAELLSEMIVFFVFDLCRRGVVSIGNSQLLFDIVESGRTSFEDVAFGGEFDDAMFEHHQGTGLPLIHRFAVIPSHFVHGKTDKTGDERLFLRNREALKALIARRPEILELKNPLGDDLVFALVSAGYRSFVKEMRKFVSGHSSPTAETVERILTECEQKKYSNGTTLEIFELTDHLYRSKLKRVEEAAKAANISLTDGFEIIRQRPRKKEDSFHIPTSEDIPGILVALERRTVAGKLGLSPDEV